jgi:hypothetical protein
MAIKLVVTNEFADYVKGQEITDPDEISRVLNSHLDAHVVKVAVPDAAPQVNLEAKSPKP